jgi:ribosomal protein S18 acetylase RimI-like enzyme
VLTESDIGHRVVVRRVAGERDGRPVFTDLLGQLVRLDARELELRPDRDGDHPVVVPLPDVLAAKRVPPRRHRIGAEELERIAARTWPAPRTEPLGGWLLRFGEGFTSRANTALVTGDPGTDLPTALDRVTAWYRALHRRPAVQLPLPAAADVDAHLEAAGWPADPTVHVLTASLADVTTGGPAEAATGGAAGAGAAGAAALDLAITREPAEDWLAMAGARKGSLPAAARAILTGPEQRAFAEIRHPGETGEAGEAGHAGRLVAIGRGAISDGWLGITLVEVVPELRRRGLARWVLRALVDWAAGHGATDAFLQVEEHNEAARALYRGAGFRLHHTYRYRRHPDG